MSWSNCYVFLPGTNTAAMPRGALAAYRWPALSNIVSDGSWCDRSMIIGPCDLRETNSLCSHEPTGGCDHHAFLVSTSAINDLELDPLTEGYQGNGLITCSVFGV